MNIPLIDESHEVYQYVLQVDGSPEWIDTKTFFTSWGAKEWADEYLRLAVKYRIIEVQYKAIYYSS